MEQTTKKVFSRIGLSLALTTIVVYIGESLLRVLIDKFIPSLTSSGWTQYLLLIFFYVIGVPLFYLLTKGLPDGEIKESKKLSIKEILIFFVICYATFIVINSFTVFLLHLLSLLKGSSVLNPATSLISNNNILGMIIFAGILSPIVEEILFRKLMLNKLRCYGDKIAIITTAVMFGLFHGNFSQFFYAVALGLIFAYVTLKTGTIKYSIILHICINFMGGAATVLLANQNIYSIIFTVIVIALLLLGIIFFILKIRKVSLCPGDVQIIKGSIFKTTCLNLGMLLYFIINLALMIYILFI